MSGDQALRSAMRKALLAGGVPARSIDEVADLSIHASAQAMDAMNAVILRASDPRIAVCVFGVTISLLQQKLTDKQNGLPDLARQMGMAQPVVVEVEVSP